MLPKSPFRTDDSPHPGPEHVTPAGRPNRLGAPHMKAAHPGLAQERVVLNLPQTPDRLWKRLYVRGVDDDLEKLHGFRPGGYCTAQLQDELHNGQYRIIHKLGHGGYATVWLCRDQHTDKPSYVAIKILVANEEKKCNELSATAIFRGKAVNEASNGHRLCFPVKQFTSQSPNGTHICLVYPVLGPMASKATAIFESEENELDILKQVSKQAVEALAVLHSHGICHGDFRPSNILLSLQGLDGLEEEQVYEVLGEPETAEIHMRKDPRPTPEMPYSPKYLVYPIDFEDVDLEIISPHTHIIDFGQSFNISQQPSRRIFGIPANYAAPEVILDDSGSLTMDLWSLGCTLFEIRFGRRLFDVFQLQNLRKSDYVNEIAYLLGEPPEPWIEYYEESDTESGSTPSTASQSLASEEDTHTEPREERVRSIREKLGKCHKCNGPECKHPRFQLITEDEAESFADLLEKLLRYNPTERIAAQDVLLHPWFR